MSRKRESVSHYYFFVVVLALILIAGVVVSVLVGREDLRYSGPRPDSIEECSVSSYLTSADFDFPVDIELLDTNLLVVDSVANSIDVYNSEGSIDFSLPGEFVSPLAAELLSNSNYLVAEKANGLSEIAPDGEEIWNSVDDSVVLENYDGAEIASFYVIDEHNYIIVYTNTLVKYERGHGEVEERAFWEYSRGSQFVDVELVSGDVVLVADKGSSEVYEVDGKLEVRGEFSYTATGGARDVEKQGDSVIMLEDSGRVIEVSYSDPSDIIVEYDASSLLSNPRDIEYVGSLLYRVADGANRRIVDVDCNVVLSELEANAGGPYEVVEDGTVLLDASLSIGEITDYIWELDRAVVCISQEATCSYDTSALTPGDYILDLTVSDGVGEATDKADLTVANDIDCGDSLTGDNVLGEDLTCTKEGLLIEESDVSLDCGDHIITGISGIGLTVKYGGVETTTINNIVVENCHFEGFDTGMLIYEVDSSDFTGNYILDYDEDGINVNLSDSNIISGGIGEGNGVGVHLDSADGNTIEIDEINYSALKAVELLKSDENTIEGLLARADDDVDYIYLEESDNNVFTDVEVVNGAATAEGNGVYLADGSDNNFFELMTIRNFASGVISYDADNNVFSKVDWEDSNILDVSSNGNGDIVLVNPHLFEEGDVDDRSVGLRYDVDDGEIEVKWYLELFAEDGEGDELEGVDIDVEDVLGSDVYSGETDDDGTTGVINLTEYLVEEDSGLSFIIYTPHQFTATYGGSDGEKDSAELNISDLDKYTFEFDEVDGDNGGGNGGGDSRSCVSDWDCGLWGECISGTQTRVCTDLNNCVVPTDEEDTSRSCSTSGGSESGSGDDDLTGDTEGDKVDGEINLYYIVIPLIIIALILVIVVAAKYLKKPGRKTGFIVKPNKQSSTVLKSRPPLKGDESKISSFIKDARNHGYTDDKIRNALLDKGWSTRKIDKFLK